MKRIVILDTWVNNRNLGNRIIMEAVERELRTMFPDDFVYSAPVLEFPQARAGRSLIRSADRIFLAGTNVLSGRMNRTGWWKVGLGHTPWYRGVVLMGVGWFQYEDHPTSRYTRLLLRRVLDRDLVHAVRDSYTAERLGRLGFACVNTGCPSIWGLTDAIVGSIPERKAATALVTFTQWRANRAADARLLEIVRSRYERVKVWPQMYEDRAYARELGGDLELVSPSLEALDECLEQEQVDYIGTRLHAGIRALQHGRRTIIVAIDNRAAEMGRDFALPIVERAEIEEALPRLIDGEWRPQVRVDRDAIVHWKAQFTGGVLAAADVPAPRLEQVG